VACLLSTALRTGQGASASKAIAGRAVGARAHREQHGRVSIASNPSAVRVRPCETPVQKAVCYRQPHQMKNRQIDIKLRLGMLRE